MRSRSARPPRRPRTSLAELPRIETARLVLRAFAAGDAPVVQRLCGDRELAEGALNIPHPYPPGLAADWISSHRDSFDRGESLVLAVEEKESGGLVGAISLRFEPQHRRAEVGYWVGRPYWGSGFCTEALRALLPYVFGELGLNRVDAHHFTRNPASGRVMQKAGMTHEGTRRGHTLKDGEFLDSEAYGILGDDLEAQRSELA